MEDNKSHDNEVIPMGTASVADIVTENVPEPTKEDIEKAKTDLVADNKEDVVAAAKNKYEDSINKCENYEKTFFAGPVKEFIYKRFEEDSGFCDDFLQEHKTFERCMKYMSDKARKEAPSGARGLLVISNDFLEWMEDYFRMDDKAIIEKEKKEEEERKKKAAELKKKAKEKKENVAAKTSAKNKDAKSKVSSAKEDPKQKKKSGDIEGQMDLFSMMEM